MSKTYKLVTKFMNTDDGATNSVTINNVDSGVTKAKVEAFGTKYGVIYGSNYVLDTANLITTDTNEIYPGV